MCVCVCVCVCLLLTSAMVPPHALGLLHGLPSPGGIPMPPHQMSPLHLPAGGQMVLGGSQSLLRLPPPSHNAAASNAQVRELKTKIDRPGEERKALAF